MSLSNLTLPFGLGVYMYVRLHVRACVRLCACVRENEQHRKGETESVARCVQLKCVFSV